MRVLLLTEDVEGEPDIVRDLGRCDPSQVVDLVVTTLNISDHESSVVCSTINHVWLTVTLATTDTQRTLVLAIDHLSTDIHLAAVVMKLCKMSATEAMHGELPAAVVSHLA